MTFCEIGPLEVKRTGEESARLNLLVPLYGKGRADFTSAALSSIQTTPRKDSECGTCS